MKTKGAGKIGIWEARTNTAFGSSAHLVSAQSERSASDGPRIKNALSLSEFRDRLPEWSRTKAHEVIFY